MKVEQKQIFADATILSLDIVIQLLACMKDEKK